MLEQTEQFESAEQKEHDRLRDDAGNCVYFAWATCLFSLVCLFIGFTSEARAIWFALALALFGLCLIGTFLGQMFHIRAALQKHHLKK